MSDAWEAQIREVSEQGARRYSAWDEPIFKLLAGYPGSLLRGRMRADPQRDKVMTAWLKLAAEALGLGYVDRASGPYFLAPKGPVPESVTLMGRCLFQLAPEQLPAYPADRAIALLARTWNLCEGLAAQPLWVNRYVVSASAEAPALEKLDEFLATTLAPALAPARASTFAGNFTLATLDTRKVMDEFLPGDMHLAAPCVLCVHDRLAKDVHLGVFLAPGGAARFLGPQPCLGPGPEEKPPPVEALKDGVRVNGKDVVVQRLGMPHRTLAARSGYVVVSAVDSQRLWVLDTP